MMMRRETCKEVGLGSFGAELDVDVWMGSKTNDELKVGMMSGE